MIKTSKKAARKLGEDLATMLHAQTTIEGRCGVLAAKSVILEHFGYQSIAAFQDGWDSVLDLLEPLSSPRTNRCVVSLKRINAALAKIDQHCELVMGDGWQPG